jgi:hypothetical protein
VRLRDLRMPLAVPLNVGRTRFALRVLHTFVYLFDVRGDTQALSPGQRGGRVLGLRLSGLGQEVDIDMVKVLQEDLIHLVEQDEVWVLGIDLEKGLDLSQGGV